ncbi:MAG: 5-formyltetrahydrofolate cyclo-ligase [Chlamydiales bacterium]|nr:5-formyltetrahydrofolate cyclo-ligase [Chlamydiales bacterium]
MDLPQSKQSLREHYLAMRAALSAERRYQAAAAILSVLQAECRMSGYVMSYASFGSELDTSEINDWLAEQGRLVLPCVDGQALALHHIVSCKADLQLSKWGIMEPNSRSPIVAGVDIVLVIVPGIAFDTQKHRLGYGKGYYDRLLADLPAKTVGIGFSEQLHPVSLPTSPTDIAMGKVILV